MQALLGRLAAGEDLSAEEITAALDRIMSGECGEQEIALFLTGLAHKGETVDEIAGAARAMRKHMTGVPTSRPNLLDTCGTGGDGSNTFNISTAAAIVAAAAGVTVAKHGNRAASSRSGSADVLAELGVNVEAAADLVGRCVDELGIGFCYARTCHPAMKHVAEVRRKLAMPTVFNLLGPLCNPAQAPYQLLGAGRPNSQHRLAEALALLETKRALVVRGEDGLGEVSLAGSTLVCEVVDGTLREYLWQPEDFKIARSSHETLTVESPAESAVIIRGVLDGVPGPPRDIVVLNAAAALLTVQAEKEPAAAAERVQAAIDSGAARTLLARLAEMSNA